MEVSEQQVEQTETTQEETKEFSNADWKSHPLTQKLTNQLAELQRAEEARKQAEIDATKKAELEKAKSEQRYDEALRLLQEESEAKIKALETEALKAQMKASLLSAGGKSNEGLVKVAMAEYDAEQHGTVDEYVGKMKESEEYSVFFAQPEGRVPHDAPGKLPTGQSTKLTKDQIRAYEKSDDREKRLLALKVKKEYFAKHGTFEGLLD